MTARVCENQGERRSVSFNFAGSHIPPGDSTNNLRLAKPHRAGAVRVSDFRLDVVFADTVRVKTNLANRFTVQLVLAIPFVDCASLTTALCHFLRSEPFRPFTIGVTVNRGAGSLGKLDTIIVKTIINTFNEQSRANVNTDENIFRPER